MMAVRRRDHLILPGISDSRPKKNFVLENIRKLKGMQKVSHERPEKTSTPLCLKKPINIRGSIYQKRRRLCTSVDGLGSGSMKTHVSTPITAVAALHPMKHPLGGKNDDYSDPLIQYESKKCLARRNGNVFTRETTATSSSLDLRSAALKADPDVELSAGDGAKLALLAKIIRTNNKDFVKKNTQTVYQGKVKPPKPDPTRAPPNYKKGVVPKYLEEVKKVINKSEKNDCGDVDPLCPPGHVRLSDEERKEHLAKIKQSYSDLVTQLNMLPMRSDSLRIRQKRIEMEKELERLEAGIKIFSKEKLYVKLAS